MAINTIIKNIGAEKKPLSLKTLLGEALDCGASDGIRLMNDVIGKNDFIAYDPKNLARGIKVIWNEEETENIGLSVLSPTTDEEIGQYFNIIRRIASEWNCEITINDKRVEKAKLSEAEKDARKSNLASLNEMTKKVKQDNTTAVLYCTMWPIVINTSECATFSNAFNTLSYSAYLHKKQALEAYYAAPSYYTGEKGIMGVYVITQNVPTILPRTPGMLYSLKDDDGQDIVINEFRLVFYSAEKKDIVLDLPYNEMVRRLPVSRIEFFDADNFLIPALTLDDIAKC